jgi:glycosyltransferase involved in cell wall biosynthesis
MSQSVSGWPKLSLVTAVFNGERYLEETLRCVIGQNYPNLEYIIVNDGSIDGTAQIIRQYEKHFSCVIEQENLGLYAALNAGFAKATGEIFGWLNSNDLLHVNGLKIVGSVFGDLPNVEWITGFPTYFTDEGLPIVEKRLARWSRGRFLCGANRFIQQESTYWRRSLWERAGGRLETKYRAEGDFDLWIRFFRHAQLYTVDGLIGGYRCHPNALSQGNLANYTATCDRIADQELASAPGLALAKTFRKMSRFVQHIPKVRVVWKKGAIDPLYRVSASDWPPIVHRIDGKWVMKP